jgi:hypothetical protein
MFMHFTTPPEGDRDDSADRQDPRRNIWGLRSPVSPWLLAFLLGLWMVFR